MVGVAAHAGDAAAVGFDDDAAAGAAITADGFYFSHAWSIATPVPVVTIGGKANVGAGFGGIV
jgi:hypothetical protein